jgi:asparagine synthase (glutamine-hydrolysing)
LSFPKKTLNQLVETALPAMDEPISDPAFPMLVELFSHVPRDFRVVLTGDGSDEIFLSYIDYCRLLKNRSGFRGWVAGKVAKRLLNIAAQVDINIFFRIAKRIIMEANLPIGERFDMLQAYSSWGVADGMPWFESLKAKDDGPAALWRYSLAHKLPEYLLVKADRASMYYSFESRTPYLNHDLFQYFFSCKFKNSFLGKKNIILNRLNEFLGEELGFTKRGFFASGQNHIYRDSNATWHSLLQDYFKDRLNDLSFLNRIDSMTYYRLYILNSWIKMKCV